MTPNMRRRKTPSAIRAALQDATNEDGKLRGLFFTTSGKLMSEIVRERALYNYVWTTNPAPTTKA